MHDIGIIKLNIWPRNNSLELGKLREIENKAFRHILQVPSYAAVEFLRGEIMPSNMITRDMNNKILYLKHASTNKNNELLKYILNIELTEKIQSGSKH